MAQQSTPQTDTANNALLIEQYDYPLPEARIARYPLPERDQAQLLLHQPNSPCSHGRFVELPERLQHPSLIVFNTTKVAPVRLFFQNENGASIEVFCLEPADSQPVYEALEQTCPQEWNALVGNRKRWKAGQSLKAVLKTPLPLELTVQYLEPTEDAHRLRLHWTPQHLSLGEVFELLGKAPLPPYLKRPAEDLDRDRYQTVYAQQQGAVAAPTAGLHFTDRVLTGLEKQGHERVDITLHVGAGTFRPVKVDHALDHLMHAERFSVSLAALRALADHPGPIVAVGTTALRTLESLYVLGTELKRGAPLLNENGEVFIAQWSWRQWAQETSLSRREALQQVIQAAEQAELSTLHGHTQLMVVPGYPFGVVEGLITNFHQPRSTLLLLIAAFIGSDWRKVYEYALDNGFRFLSYGDSSLLWRQPRT